MAPVPAWTRTDELAHPGVHKWTRCAPQLGWAGRQPTATTTQTATDGQSSKKRRGKPRRYSFKEETYDKWFKEKIDRVNAELEKNASLPQGNVHGATWKPRYIEVLDEFKETWRLTEEELARSAAEAGNKPIASGDGAPASGDEATVSGDAAETGSTAEQTSPTDPATPEVSTPPQDEQLQGNVSAPSNGHRLRDLMAQPGYDFRNKLHDWYLTEENPTPRQMPEGLSMIACFSRSSAAASPNKRHMDNEAFEAIKMFCNKFYSGTRPRTSFAAHFENCDPTSDFAQAHRQSHMRRQIIQWDEALQPDTQSMLIVRSIDGFSITGHVWKWIHEKVKAKRVELSVSFMVGFDFSEPRPLRELYYKPEEADVLIHRNSYYVRQRWNVMAAARGTPDWMKVAAKRHRRLIRPPREALFAQIEQN